LNSEGPTICLILPSLKIGGMEKVMIELCHYLSPKNTHKTVLILLGKNDGIFKVPPNIKVYEPDGDITSGHKFVYSVRVFLYLRKLLKLLKPYSLLSFGETYNSFVLLASFLLPIKVYVSDRSKPDKDWGAVQNRLRRILYPSAFGIISQTNYSKVFLSRETRHKNIKVIPNPCRFRNSSIQGRDKIVLNVGRLIKTKRVDILIKMFAEVKEEGWKLWIIGDGPEKENLIKWTSENEMEDHISFLGSLFDLDDFYSKVGIFAFTSESEGFPNALLEAISYGLPSISFDCVAGPSDLIEHEKNGFLIPQGDIKRYKMSLRKLMLDENLRHEFSKKAFEKAIQYDIEIIGKEYFQTLIQ
jgi:GalNAc-alpha-(1->4)-GalNAc-alpha-(1->3)-diNAcBac-PP-undecaprenol alpha-1,4-N-acetyl-D-galactosaminyltransferase